MAAATAARMREIDRIATEETGPSLLQMMENAGRSMAVLAMRTLGPGAPAARVLVVAGAGGNGAGGIAPPATWPQGWDRSRLGCPTRSGSLQLGAAVRDVPSFRRGDPD